MRKRKKVKSGKWTKAQLDISLKTNVRGYGSAIAVAVLYKKIYGEFPKIGLSGTQAEFADAVLKKLPKRRGK